MKKPSVLIIATLSLALIQQPAQAQAKTFGLNEITPPDFNKIFSKNKVIVVGEMHGTSEVPRFVLQLIKSLSTSKTPVTVGLEIDRSIQGDIDEFLKTGDFEKLLTLDHFKIPDGRTSIAMGQLIKGLREISGIEIICFDTAPNIDAGLNRDSLMAVTLATKFKQGKMVVLTGNLHANLNEGYWRRGFKSATFYFKKFSKLADDELISLNTYFSSGTIWNCMQDGCHERPAYSNPGITKTEFENFLTLNDIDDGSGYNGFIYFEKVTSSKPLVNEN